MSNQYLTNLRLLKKTDIFLASYPRSGNTWIRLLLSDALLQLQGFQTTTGGNIIPDAYKISINEWNNQIDTKIKFRIIKTHEPLFIQQTLELENRVFYLFRKPADCLCSFYYYSLRYEKNKENDKGIDEFCLDTLEQWCSHVTTYIGYKQENPESIIFLSYEKLSYNPVEVMNYIIGLLGWKNYQLVCKKSVKNQEFNKLKNLSKEEKPEKMGFWEDNGYQDFFRKGKVNSSQEELSPETLRIIEEKAMPIYKQATSFEPIFPFEFSGEIFEKQLQKQIEKKRENLDKFPKHFVAARHYYRLDELEKAITSYRQAIRLNPNSAWSHHNLGKTLSKQQNWDEAIAAYQQAIKLNPNSASFYYNLAEALMQQGNLEEAIANYSKAIEIKPSFSIGHNSLGEAFAQQGKLVEAVGCFRKAIELNSNYFKAYGNLAELLAEKGRLEEAVGFYQEAIKLNPSYQITNPKLREAVK
jgi:tetratricopeptide (TPR) repeat protein